MTDDRRTKFYLDPADAKWKGVCAGIADYTGVDVTLVRVGVVMLTLLTQGAMLIAYILTAWLAPKKPSGLYLDRDDQKFWQGVRANPNRSTQEIRSTFRDIDRRLADIESYYVNKNSRLNDEIEALR
jgi:phage shock protein C